MNTPKLNNALVSVIARGNTLQPGVASAAPAVDFSQLLGAKREQISTTAASSTAANGRRTDTATSGRPSVADVGARNDAHAGSSRTRQAEDTDSRSAQQADKPRDASPQADRSRDALADNGAPRPTRDSAHESNVATAEEARDPKLPSEDASPAADSPAVVAAEPAPAPAQAQLVAQPDIALMAAVQASQQETAPHELASTNPATLTASGPRGSGVAGTAPAATAPLANATVAVTTALPIDPASTAPDANGMSAAPKPVPSLQNFGTAQLVGQAATAALTPQAPELAFAAAASAAPAAPGQDTQAAVVQHTATPPLPLPVATGAAALSLQDFTAMVQAARATSGTSLQNTISAAGAPGSTIPGAGLSGIPLGALIPGQSFAAGAPVAGSIAAPLASPQWPTELGRQFISIAQAGSGLGQTAELRLDPPELGPLRITINLNDNIAHAVFSSPHASVRQTVESALPQLQQMLEQAGISLGQANVNDQQAGRNAEGGNGSSDQPALGNGLAADDAAETPALAMGAGKPADPDALVDTFA